MEKENRFRNMIKIERHEALPTEESVGKRNKLEEKKINFVFNKTFLFIV